MGSYWDPLADVLPESVRDAMTDAQVMAIHHGGGREGEPVLLAGVRELLKHVTLKSVADEQIEQIVRHSRHQAEQHRGEIQRITENTNRLRADEHNALARVWQLYRKTRDRKTVQREDLRRALAPDEYVGEALL